MPAIIPPVLYDMDYEVRRHFVNGLVHLVEKAGLHFVQGEHTIKVWLYGRSFQTYKSALNAIAAAIESHRETRPDYPTAEQLLGWVVLHREVVDQLRPTTAFRVVHSLTFTQMGERAEYLRPVFRSRLPKTMAEMEDFNQLISLLLKHADEEKTHIALPVKALMNA